MQQQNGFVTVRLADQCRRSGYCAFPEGVRFRLSVSFYWVCGALGDGR